MDDLLHLLDTTKVSQHVTDRYDVSVVDQLASDFSCSFDRAGTDGLKSVG